LLLGDRLSAKSIPISTSKVISSPLVDTISNLTHVKNALVKIGHEKWLQFS
jgi:hypothetical protein